MSVSVPPGKRRYGSGAEISSRTRDDVGEQAAGEPVTAGRRWRLSAPYDHRDDDDENHRQQADRNGKPALNTSALREAAGSAGTSRGDLPAPAALSPTLTPPIRSADEDDPRPPASRERFSSTESGASFPF